MGKVARWAATIAVGAALASGCSSDPMGAHGGTKKGLHGGPSKVLDGPYTWPSGATLTVASTGPTSALLSWPAPSGSVGVAHYRVYQNGSSVATVAGTSLTYELTGLTTGTSYALAVQAEDGMGGATTDGPTATYVAVTPSASFVASPLDRSVATAFGPATSFLYTGTDPVQPGVSSGTILPTRAAVIRGHVYARDGGGSPLTGVLVTVVGHPEFGSTLTQADGEYDLAVNGGQTLRLHFALVDYLPVERVVQTPWQDYVTASDVALVQLDSQVTAVDVSSSSMSTQVARGTASTDASGTRQATLIVPPGTEATMTLPGGSTSPLTTMNVRATEYSVGDTGSTAVPADLPPTSAYSYVVEFTADEALAAGATKVTFSQPLSLYVEDFLSLPVGTTVPSGYYDPSKGAWLSAENGIIIQIVSVTGSAADVDVDGDGIADIGGALTTLGITSDELDELASLYATGQKLWRTPVGHFTSHSAGPGDAPPSDTPPAPMPCLVSDWEIPCTEADHCTATVCANEWYGCPGGSASTAECSYYCCPDGYALNGDSECQNNDCDSPPEPLPPPDGPNDCHKENASTIACQRQSLGEDIAIAGTPYSLHYDSERQKGRQAELTIPVSSVLGGSPTGIEMRASVAGRVFTQSFGVSGGQSTTVTWDGYDGYGRLLQGGQPIEVALRYLYKGVYQNSGAFGVTGTGTPSPRASADGP